MIEGNPTLGEQRRGGDEGASWMILRGQGFRFKGHAVARGHMVYSSIGLQLCLDSDRTLNYTC